MSIEAIVGKAARDVITIGEDMVSSGVSSAARKMCSVSAVIDFCLLGIHLGVDRYGPHDMESDMFLWDAVNHNSAKKQRVHEIYAPAIAESRYATAALYAMAAPFFVAGLVLYPIEKAAEYVSAAAERISKRYENSRVYKAFAGILDSISKRISIDEDAGIPDEKEAAYNIKPSPAIASLQNLLNEERLPQVHGGKSI